MARKTHLKPETTDHAQDAINDALTHAEMKRDDEARAAEEDEALKRRGEAIEADEAKRRAAADKAKRRAIEQFSGICEAIRVRDQIVARAAHLLIVSRAMDLDTMIRMMVHIGHDAEIARIAITAAHEFEIADNYVTMRRAK